MAGMQTLDTPRSEDVYEQLDEAIMAAKRTVHCYSRLPMRQLLRFVPSNQAEMWWLSEHETPRAVHPDPAIVLDHIASNTHEPTALVVLEGIDWLVSRSSEAHVLNMLQSLDTLSKDRDFEVVIAGDSLALNPRFWARMCSLAPRTLLSSNTAEDDEQTVASEVEPLMGLEPNVNQREDVQTLVHLVHLPEAGFTHAVLARRMLQWKRMGFDLAALGPAMATSDMKKAHSIYKDVERHITAAIDAIRLMEQESHRLSVSEHELYNYRFMSLNSVLDGVNELDKLLSTR